MFQLIVLALVTKIVVHTQQQAAVFSKQRKQQQKKQPCCTCPALENMVGLVDCAKGSIQYQPFWMSDYACNPGTWVQSTTEACLILSSVISQPNLLIATHLSQRATGMTACGKKVWGLSSSQLRSHGSKCWKRKTETTKKKERKKIPIPLRRLSAIPAGLPTPH